MQTDRCARAAFFVSVVTVAASVPRAQCANVWQPLGGLDGTVEKSIQWDPDGAGPASPVLVVGGAFTTAGGIAANRIAAWNPVSGLWSAFGSGTNGTVQALAALPNGDLVAAGSFSAAGGLAVNGIARWNGTSWSSLGTGLPAAPGHLAVAPNGDLVAAGMFTPVGVSPVLNVAVWDGAVWTLTSAGSSFYAPTALTVLADGSYLVGLLNGLFRGTGSNWNVFGSAGAPQSSVLRQLPNGDMIAAGTFQQISGVPMNGIARWDGVAWQPLGGGLAGGLLPMTEELLVLPDGDLVVGGLFSSAGGTPAANLARWDGSTWSSFGTGTNAAVAALTFLDDGRLVVGGYFTTAGGFASSRIALLATTCPASATVGAPGCPGPGGGNVLAAIGLPWADGVFRANASGLPATAIVVAVTSPTPVVPSFPMQSVFPTALPGCDLHVAPDILQAIVATNGTARSDLFLPNAPPIVGVQFFHQMVVIEVDAFGGWPTVAATNVLDLTAGAF